MHWEKMGCARTTATITCKKPTNLLRSSKEVMPFLRNLLLPSSAQVLLKKYAVKQLTITQAKFVFKIMYIAEERFRDAGIRDKTSTVSFVFL